MADDLNSVFFRLTEAARTGATEYASSYMKAVPELLHLYEEIPGLTGEVRANGIHDMSMAVKTALLYNERVTLDVIHEGDSMSISGFTPEGMKAHGMSEEMQLTVSKAHTKLVEEAIKARGVQFGFMMPNGDDVDRFLVDLAELIRHGKFIPRPSRTVMLRTERRTPEGGWVWETMDAAAGSDLNSWHLVGERDALGKPTATEKAISAEAGSGNALKAVAQEIVVPYLSGVSLSDYAQIIQDEDDVLIEFRSSMKQLIEEYSKGSKTLPEFQADIINPRIAKISRAFEKISSMGRLRIGGAAVATVVLTLATYSTGGLAAAVAAVGGTAGFMSTVKEAADRAEKLRSLKDDPLHLLWRLRQASV